MVLGGVSVPAESGPIGHSDGDVVLHAVIDSILGAAVLGDIGTMFPDTDASLKGIASGKMLKAAMDRVRNEGWTIQNLDVIVILERPKISPFIASMKDAIAVALGVESGAVSVKGKSNEGFGEIGKGEAVACHVVVLLEMVGQGI
jgi:2-C-methyl-D-erythritol 2,4-cyclodiphosphate synthase